MIYRGYRYRGDELYDTLVEELFRRYHPFADQLNMVFARRGNAAGGDLLCQRSLAGLDLLPGVSSRWLASP